MSNVVMLNDIFAQLTPTWPRRDGFQIDRISMGQLRTGNKRHKRAIIAAEAAGKAGRAESMMRPAPTAEAAKS